MPTREIFPQHESPSKSWLSRWISYWMGTTEIQPSCTREHLALTLTELNALHEKMETELADLQPKPKPVIIDLRLPNGYTGGPIYNPGEDSWHDCVTQNRREVTPSVSGLKQEVEEQLQR